MNDPSIITEGIRNYSLGSFDGKTMDYDFAQILVYLNAKGRILFGNKFRIYRDDRATIKRLCAYYVKDQSSCRKYNLDPSKGLLLCGPIGCGKTCITKLMRHLVPHQRWIEVVSCRNIVFGFNHIGYKTVEDYGDGGSYCFDNLGLEANGHFYGQHCNVLGEILLSRYDLFIQTKGRLRTHGTTHLMPEELKQRYGMRVWSRMKQLFNIVSFPAKSRDKRR